MAIEDPSRWPRGALHPQKVGNDFVDKPQLLGRYSRYSMFSVLTDNILKRRWLTAADEVGVEGNHHEATVLSLHEQRECLSVRGLLSL
jgi:hypothetical protein